MKFIMHFLLIATIGSFLACGGETSSTADKSTKTEAEVSQKTEKSQASSGKAITNEGITLTPVASPAFPDAKLSLTSPTKEALKKGKVKFDFGVENYELGNQTPDAGKKLCANSAKGQHIHFILNNAPYAALYEPKHEVDMAEGVYTMLAFLSRSYHESIKTSDAVVAKNFVVGEPEINQTPDLSKKHLFYSRPKGRYVGAEDIKNIMLDFYLLNTDLVTDGDKINVKIDDIEFTLDKWQPYMIEGLAEGKHIIQMQLVDSEGEFIRGPFNNVIRAFEVYNDEPIEE